MNLLARKAHVFNTVKTCEALSTTDDVKVNFITTSSTISTDKLKSDVFQYVGVSHEFCVTFLDSFGTKFIYNKYFLHRVFGLFYDTLVLIVYLFKNRNEFDVLYSRDHLLFLVFIFNKYILKKKFIFEVHYKLSNKFSQFIVGFVVKMATGVIAITRSLEAEYRSINKKITTIFCAASEPDLYKGDFDTMELRRGFDLPTDKIIVGYTGNMYLTGNNDSYGIDDVIRVFSKLPSNFIFVGVGKKDLNNFEHENLAKKLSIEDRIIIAPWTSKQNVIKYINAFDILIIPKSGNRVGNSPTKIFEYLPTGKPIVAANTEAISEVLNESNSILVDFDNIDSWVSGIITASNVQVGGIINQAMSDSMQYTWQNRSKNIMKFIHSI